MQKLVFENSNGVSVDLTDFEKYGITDWSGLSECSMDIQSQQVPFNDGSVFLDALLQDRTLSFTVAVNDGGDLQKRYELKRELISILNPKLGEGYLYYTNDYLSRKIKCIPEVPTFPTKNMDNAGTLKASISFTACNPYWESLEEKLVYFHQGERTVIQNNGDVDATCKIDFLIGNTVENLKLTSFTTGQKIEINGDVSTNVKVNTEMGKKSAVLENETVNVITCNSSKIKVIYIEDLNKFVALYETYGICISEDGEIWSSVLRKTCNSLYWNDTLKKVFATSSNGKIYVSSDLSEWEVLDTTLTEKITGITYGNNMLVAVGYGGSIIKSTDEGVTWEVVTTDVTFTKITFIHYSSYRNIFILGGEQGLLAWGSSGLSSFTQITTGTTYSFNAISECESLRRFVVVGYTVSATSTNGKDWTVNTSDGINYDVIYNEEKQLFIKVGYSHIYYSQDGLNWYDSNVTFSEWLNSIAYSKKGGMFITVGYKGKSYKSYDGRNYEILSTIYTDNLYSVCCLGEKNIAGGYGNLFESSDLINWQALDIPLGLNDCVVNILYVEELNKIYALVDADSGNVVLYIIDKDNFESWNKVILNDQNNAIAISYSPELKRLVLSTIRASYYSDDEGLTWTNSITWTGYIYDMIYSDKFKFVCSGNAGRVWHSEDGINWEMQTVNSYYYKGICASDKGIVLFGNDASNTIMYSNYSEDLKLWKRTMIAYTDDTITSVEINKAIFNAELGMYCVIGRKGLVFTSVNGTDWKKDETYLGVDLNDVSYSAKYSEYVIVGYEFSILSLLFKEGENVISKITTDSDMNFKLKVGTNEILLSRDSGIVNARITFNEKYIGM